MTDRIPSEQECLDLMREYRMLPNIADHSQQVKNVSLAIVDDLRDPASVNRDLVIACALLHDIAKTRSIETGEIRHDLMGGEMMRALGFETIAVAVETHVILSNYHHEGPLEAREIVFYADKRVMHDRVVSVDERVDDLALRYGINDKIREMISENRKFIVLVESKIRSFMKNDMEAVIAALYGAMARRYLIIDCFVDEPACFGVPPFVSPYPRYIFGALLEGGASPDSIEYLTVEDLRRRDFRLDRDYDWAFIIGGAVVPGKYLGSRIGTLAEIGRIIDRNRSQNFAVGGPAARVVPPGQNTLPVTGDIEFFAHGAARGEVRDGTRSVKDIARWAVLGAPVVTRHPDYPHLICEMETYRGCPRSAHCSFCSEGAMGEPEFRDADDILAEVEALVQAGITRYRLGRQADILQYGSSLREWRGGFPRPEPSAIRRLFGPLAEMKRSGRIRVLNVDNANPGTIANFPDESSAIINFIAGAVTPGDTLALGVESFDEAVIAGNALKIAPGQVLPVVKIINEAGGIRVDAIPALLPGINLLHGLKGESDRTFEVNYRSLCEIRDSGLLLRRINIRKVQPFPGTPLFENRPRISRSLAKRFEYYRDRIRNDIDIPMMKRVFPAGTVIRESMVQEERAGYSYGKQIASYSVTAKIPLPIDPGSFIDAVVVDHRERSLLALPLPLSLNLLPQKALAMIRGIGNKRATEIIIRRPVKSMDDIEDVLVDVDPAVRGWMVL